MPATVDGEPVDENITVAILFRLEDYYQKYPEHRPKFLPYTMEKKSPRKKRKQKSN